MQTIKVMLVDDHAVVRAGYRFLLENRSDIQVIAEADSGEDALGQYPQALPDVLVMDLTMPGAGGLKTIGKFRQQYPAARILVSTMHDSTMLLERALQAGAAGYICKNGRPETLITAIVKVAAGDNYIDAELAQNMVIQQHDRLSPLGSLSQRELQILCLFAEGRPLEAIAEELSLSNKTISNYLTLIKDKLQVNTSAELVRFALSKGLATL